MKENIRKYQQTEKGKRTTYEAIKRYNKKLRMLVIQRLGSKCCFCGFDDVRALQVDHINGGGSKEIKELGANKIYRKILDGDMSYQLLCANCNWIKRAERNENKGYNFKEETEVRERDLIIREDVEAGKIIGLDIDPYVKLELFMMNGRSTGSVVVPS